MVESETDKHQETQGVSRPTIWLTLPDLRTSVAGLQNLIVQETNPDKLVDLRALLTVAKSRMIDRGGENLFKE